MHLALTPEQKTSLSITLAAFLLIIIGLVISYSMSTPVLIAVAILAGAIGGLGHEFVQSGGTITFFKVKEDGVYLGSMAGIVIGAMAGLLFIRSFTPPVDVNILLVESLLAGLGFKGVAEAVGGQITPQGRESLVIENVNYDVSGSMLEVTLRNTGSITIKIQKIYVATRMFDRNEPVQPTDPYTTSVSVAGLSLTPETRKIRVVTSRGSEQERSF
jgi:archaellum component FlaF (FlaF/FlaG flagellin family)